MPNTLAHFATQAMASRCLAGPPLWQWVAIGCVIPDFPWILQRAVQAMELGIDAYDLRLYATAQASFGACLILCGAIAALTRSSQRVFALLAANSLLHLLLDATETKWGNGVNLFAPLDWTLLNFGWYWPGHPIVYLLSAAGLGMAAWAIVLTPRHSTQLTRNPAKAGAALALLLGYCLLPATLLNGPANADAHYVSTLREANNRPGKLVELDRTGITLTRGTPEARLLNGETVRLTGNVPDWSGTFSLRGRFTDSSTIDVEALHAHQRGTRDAASYIGLTLLLLVVVKSLLLRQR